MADHNIEIFLYSEHFTIFLETIFNFLKISRFRKFQKNNYPKRQFKPVCLISLILCGSAGADSLLHKICVHRVALRDNLFF
jgi:hypothetical protein